MNMFETSFGNHKLNEQNAYKLLNDWFNEIKF